MHTPIRESWPRSCVARPKALVERPSREDRGVIIRAAVDTDAPEIAELLSAHLATTTNAWTDVPHTAESALAWLDDREKVLVAEDDGEVVGLAAYGWFRGAGKSGYRFTVENTVHVRESHWRTGLGRRLMETLISEARETR